MSSLLANAVLPYAYEQEGKSSGMTALGGLPLYLDLASVLRVGDSVQQHLPVRESGQGFTAVEMVLTLVMLHLAGGDCVADLERLAKDDGFVNLMNHLELTMTPKPLRHIVRRRQRREQKTRRRATLPSPTTTFRFLDLFHDAAEQSKVAPGSAYIQTPNQHLRGLSKVVADLVAQAANICGLNEATIDADATLIETQKKQALVGYKGYKAYQPFNFFLFELGMVLYSQFRDGNVPAAYGQLGAFKEAVELVPASVQKLYYRADTASYDWDLLKYMARGKNERFGVIEFAVAADISTELRQAIESTPESAWKPLQPSDSNKPDTARKQQWAEVEFVPSAICDTKTDERVRFVAIRELLPQQPLPGIDCRQLCLPFATARLDPAGRAYKVSAIVTNRDLPGDEIVRWHRQHYGKDEHSHSELKSALGGGQLPCARFGANAAWWLLAILAFNLNELMKRVVLGGHWIDKKLKAIRFAIINVPARVLARARGLVIRIGSGHSSAGVLAQICQGLHELQECVAGN